MFSAVPLLIKTLVLIGSIALEASLPPAGREPIFLDVRMQALHAHVPHLPHNERSVFVEQPRATRHNIYIVSAMVTQG